MSSGEPGLLQRRAILSRAYVEKGELEGEGWGDRVVRREGEEGIFEERGITIYWINYTTEGINHAEIDWHNVY